MVENIAKLDQEIEKIESSLKVSLSNIVNGKLLEQTTENINNSDQMQSALSLKAALKIKTEEKERYTKIKDKYKELLDQQTI